MTPNPIARLSTASTRLIRANHSSFMNRFHRPRLPCPQKRAYISYIYLYIYIYDTLNDPPPTADAYTAWAGDTHNPTAVLHNAFNAKFSFYCAGRPLAQRERGAAPRPTPHPQKPFSDENEK